MSRVVQKQIPVRWETERLSIANIEEDDIAVVQEICNEIHTEEWVTDPVDPHWVQNEVVDPELPKNGILDNHKFQVVRLKEDNQIAAYMITYVGYPTPNVAWIGELFFFKKYRKRGYGRELVAGLVDHLTKSGQYSRVRCTARLKNWPGIRFWSQVGFSKIIKVFGDKEYSRNSDADLELELSISEGVNLEAA